MTQFSQPIGVFDSGVGGLTVARAIQTRLPDESLFYFGDSARCPYGDRSPSDVLAFSVEIAEFLVNVGVKCLVVACNTATAVALLALQARFDIPVIGVIEPGAAAAVAATSSGRIGVIGTSVTMASHAYHKTIHQIEAHSAKVEQVYEYACPEFVPLVEQGIFDGAAAEAVVRKSLAVFDDLSIDTLVLGCTHYPMLASTIRRVVGPHVQVISSADATALAVERVLYATNRFKKAKDAPIYRYYTTGDGSNMKMALANWFHAPAPLDAVKRVALPLARAGTVGVPSEVSL